MAAYVQLINRSRFTFTAIHNAIRAVYLQLPKLLIYSSPAEVRVILSPGKDTTFRINSEISNRRANIKISDINITKNNGVFWDVTPCGSCKNRRFGKT
jgi:hypothetical protein